MQYQRTLDLSRPEPMTRYIDDIIYPAGDPIITILISARTIAGEVIAGIASEIGVDKTWMIAIDGAHLPGPGSGQDQCSFGWPLKQLSLGIYNAWCHPKEGPGR
jgi:hypothetical protein